MNKVRPIPTNAMVRGEGDARASFTISEDLVVRMSDGATVSLEIRLTPAEARGFARVFEELADFAEEMGDLGAADCAGVA